MAHTVIGLFDSAEEAQNAVRELLNQGFSTDHIDLSVHLAVGNWGSSTGIRPNEVTGESIGNFFGSLFGDSDQASTYSDVARRSGSIVTVHAPTEEQAHLAAQVLDDTGALDIDERAAEYGFLQRDDDYASISTDQVPYEDQSDAGLSDTAPEQWNDDTETTRRRSRIVNSPVDEQVRLRAQPGNYVNATVTNNSHAAERAAMEGSQPLGAASSIPASERVDIGDDQTHSRQIIQLFHDWENLENAYRFVRHRGYKEEEVNVIMSEQTRERQQNQKENRSEFTAEKVAEGAGAGSAIGGTVGAIIGAIAAIGTSLALPGLGLVIAGPIAAGLAGAGVGGLTGGLLGILVKSGLSEDQARTYQAGIEQGGVLLSLEAHSNEDARIIGEEWRRLGDQ
jgi:hypothetical protein